MPQVFISHASKDRWFVEQQLLKLLQRHAIEPWYSKVDIASAAIWEQQIRVGLNSSDWFLVVLSKSAANSEWVRAEVHWALENRRSNFVPVLIEECEPININLLLIRYQYIDFREEGDRPRSKLLAVWGKKLEVDRALMISLSIRRGTLESPPERRQLLIFGVAWVGRAHDADVYLSDSERMVSPRHAAFKVRQGEQKRSLWLVDMCSTNGTTLNGECVSAPMEVSLGDCIGVGAYYITVEGLSDVEST